MHRLQRVFRGLKGPLDVFFGMGGGEQEQIVVMQLDQHSQFHQALLEGWEWLRLSMGMAAR